MTVKAVGVHLGETDTRLWRVLDHYVEPVRKPAIKDWWGFAGEKVRA
jgi:hypothetical protein